MAAIRTIEAHPLDHVTGLWCDNCASFCLTSVGVAIVDGDSLEVVGRFYGTICAHCGAESVHR